MLLMQEIRLSLTLFAIPLLNGWPWKGLGLEKLQIKTDPMLAAWKSR
jgi:hypothetical protein